MKSPGSTDGMTTLIIASVLYVVISLAIYIWYAFSLSKVFPKIGAEPWKGWVPVLNEAEIFARGGVPGWSVVFYFIPGVNLYALYLRAVATGRINAMFGRGTGMTVLAVLLPPVWATLLATSGGPKTSPYEGRIAPAEPRSSEAPAPVPPPTMPSVTMAPAAPVVALPAVVPPVVAAPPPPDDEPNDEPSDEPGDEPADEPADEPGDEPEPEVAAPVVATPVVRVPPPTLGDALKPAPAEGAPAIDTPAIDTPAIDTPVVKAPPPSKDDEPKAAAVASVVIHNPWAAPPKDEVDSAPPKPGRAAIITPPPAAPTAKPDPVVTPAPAAAPAATGPDADSDDEYGETIVVDRRPSIRWTLDVEGAGAFPLPTAHVLLGRKPASTSPDTHALSVPDGTRTLSKVHARLDLGEDGWTITDLNSTNGVLVVAADGTETLLDPGAAVPVPGRFVLGKVGMSISFEDASS